MGVSEREEPWNTQTFNPNFPSASQSALQEENYRIVNGLTLNKFFECGFPGLRNQRFLKQNLIYQPVNVCPIEHIFSWPPIVWDKQTERLKTVLTLGSGWADRWTWSQSRHSYAGTRGWCQEGGSGGEIFLVSFYLDVTQLYNLNL